MSEKIPTPSTEFSKLSTNRDIAEGIPAGEERKYNILEAQEAAYAAKPFMDTATDLYDTYKGLDNFDHLEDVVGETNLSSLVAYAEKRAYDAAETKSVPELTHAEKSVIEAYQVEKELLKSEQAIYDSSDELMLSSDGLKDAIDAAYDRRKSAKDRDEAYKWQKMEAKLKRYGDYLDNDLNGGAPDHEGFAEFHPSTNRATVLLDVALYHNGELKDVDNNHTALGVRSDTRNMKELAEMNNFLAELYPQKDSTDEYKPLSDDEIAAAKAQLDQMTISSTRKSGEANTDHEAPAESHEPHYNIVESVPEAKALIYSNPDYLTELVDESEAYANFSADKVDTSNAAISANLKTMERDLPEVRQAVQNWRETSGMSFKQYIEAVSQGDIEATQDQLNAAQSAKMMLRNTFWRESEMARRMTKKHTDKSEGGDIAKAFGAEYFRS